MSAARERVQRLVDGMTIGQELRLYGPLFRKAFPCGWPSISSLVFEKTERSPVVTQEVPPPTSTEDHDERG